MFLKRARWFAGRRMLCFPMLISSLPGANPRLPEHKIEVFVRFWASGPPFSGISSTKSRFLCQNGRFFRDFWHFRAQNRHFCARRGCNASCIWRFIYELRCLKRCVIGCCIWWEATWGGNTIRGQPFGLTSCSVAEGGLGPPTSGLWARRATNCSAPRCCEHKGMYFFSYYQIFCSKRNDSLF